MHDIWNFILKTLGKRKIQPANEWATGTDFLPL